MGPRAASSPWVWGALLLCAALACAPPLPPAPTPPRVLRLLDPGPPQRWGGDGGAPIALNPAALRARWPALGPALSACLGDPLALPLAGDPGAWRKLVWQEAPRWRLELSGQGGCGLGGALELDLHADRVFPEGLEVAGRAWTAGGRELGERALARWRRQQATQLWAAGTAAERAVLLTELGRDPDPAAAAALQALAAAYPEAARDVQILLDGR